ncbi:hypothetical protein [Actinomyces succiniciruminis]|uniref:Flp/Fap pilin component n=1 Tax=Actinomyces succiniciruminis TaxID=1522002 RepID=A0A1L7RK22_9ACTO|nr:hypothetical protein [Actinomyces succiniciruminis]CED90380.1 Hypothetical protein AAM4_0485 [Actinomyces succiniciruminis]
MSNSVLAAQVRARMWLDDVKRRVAESEVGQGAAEYAGVIVVAVILVTAIITALDNYDLGEKIKGQLDKIFEGR